MNILIPHSWLKDYIDCDLSPQEIAKELSLHAFSVEKITETKDNDFIYEIEITPNRGDALSVIGIAREIKAILKQQGKNIQWKEPSVSIPKITNTNDILEVKIENSSLVPRFSAIVLDNIEIKDSPEFIKKRLEKIGIRAINNVVDITNYFMFDKGQPMHSFDYDKIKNHLMIVRESKKGEKITTLDNVERILPEGIIVVEDGEQRLIDLCGIMGAKNSETDENTKKVLLFVQGYDPVRIRKASMSLGHRTDAALRVEKGIDYGGIIPSLWEAVNMISRYAGGKISSNLIDIVNTDFPTKIVPIDYKKINKIAGVEIDNKFIDSALENLGFTIKNSSVEIPSWRYNDIDIAEDLAEEVIRLYGYSNIPDQLPIGEIPNIIFNQMFYWENFVKTYLKYQGFFECYTYSSTTKKNALENAIKITNPLSEELEYLRQSLTPQLTDVIDKNQGYSDAIKIFELASVYIPNNNDLPKQPQKLSMVVKNVDYLIFKGIIEGLFFEMGIAQIPELKIEKIKNYLAVELDFEQIANQAVKSRTYTPITTFNSIKEDLTFIIAPDVQYPQIENEILNSDHRISKLVFKDIYKNYLTLSIEYLDRQKQISSEDTKTIREIIFKNLEGKLNIKLKL